MTKDDFLVEIRAMIDRATQQGRPHVEINAGELHRWVGGYPAKGLHSMPTCCAAMRAQLGLTGGEVVFKTKSGASASFTVRYDAAETSGVTE